MKAFFALIVILNSAASFAAKTPENSEKILWETKGIGHHICSTTNVAPYTPVLCFGENESGGYAILKNNSDQEQGIATYKVVPMDKWTFLYRTTKYVQNTDVYSRHLQLIDNQNRASVIEETLTYNDESEVGETLIRSKQFIGYLPNGTYINFQNMFMFY
jgi:hypothetical protein